MNKSITYAALIVITLLVIVVLAAQFGENKSGFTARTANSQSNVRFSMQPMPNLPTRGLATIDTVLTGTGIGEQHVPAGLKIGSSVKFNLTANVQTTRADAVLLFYLTVGEFNPRFVFQPGKAINLQMRIEVVMTISSGNRVFFTWTVLPGGFSPLIATSMFNGWDTTKDYPVDFLVGGTQVADPANTFQTVAFGIIEV